MKKEEEFRFFLYNKPTVVLIDWYNISNKNNINIEKLFNYLKGYKEIIEIRFYNGVIENKEWSSDIIKEANKLGFVVISKKAKYINIKPENKSTIDTVYNKITQIINFNSVHLKEIWDTLNRELSKSISKFKCDFDAEIARDIIVNINKYDNLILFSGDGDFASTVKYIIDEYSKRVFVIYRRNAFGYPDYEEFGLINNKNCIKMCLSNINNSFK